MPKVKKWVVGDIHGCKKTLEELLFRKCRIQPGDHLYFLGDYIHRGPDSQGVIDLITGLKEHYKVRTLMGNHELMEISLFRNEIPELVNMRIDRFLELKELEIPRQTIIDTYFSDFAKKNSDFFMDLELFIELKNYFLVHAGFKIKSEDPFKDYFAMLWQRGMKYKSKVFKKKKLIVGHTPTELEEIKQNIDKDIIYLDGGCVFARRINRFGYLCAFELKEQKLYYKKYCE